MSNHLIKSAPLCISLIFVASSLNLSAASMNNAIAKANAALDQIGAQDLSKVTFKSTVVALDDLGYQAANAANKATIIKESNTNPAMRTAAENAVKTYQEW